MVNANQAASSTWGPNTPPMPRSWFRFDVLAEPHDVAVPVLIGNSGMVTLTIPGAGGGGGAGGNGGVYLTSYGTAGGGSGGFAGGSYNTTTMATPNSTLRP